MHDDVVYSDEDFEIRLSVVEGRVFLHCDIFNWSPSVYKKLLEVRAGIEQQALEIGIDYIYACTPKKKFGEMLGFEYVKPVTDTQDLMVWELKQ